MAFDQTTRNRLARFVGDARRILTDEFTRQCKQDYGIDPGSGDVSDIARLTHLNDSQRATARILRDTIDHYVAGSPSGGKRVAIERIIREQAFTVLNRLCAIRMAEARDILIQAVGKGYQSKGFQLYARVAGSALGEVGDAYRCFLFSVFDEIATDFPSLFDRFSKQGRLFPGEGALLRTLEEINHSDIDPLWAEDETIGWVYQYFNTDVERREARYTPQGKPKPPQNSRELAVRNQFFTPRYVVEFLVDNTLGRIWYEMTTGQTALRDHCRYLVRRPTEIFLKPGESAPASDPVASANLSQEELLRQPVYIPHRPLKDPRELRLLDPACGSMHFGLYAFDLFTAIYDEAWNIALGSDKSAESVETFAPFVAFAATFPDKAALLREVPRLIVEHNIHGIDIDSRAAQIAGLSLWLRAQRAWHQAGVKPADRPRITRSNIVCAEPMPGETQLLGEFIQRQFPAGERAVFGYLLEKVFDCMKLAGEAGSLLRVEEEIRSAVAEAKSLWQQVPRLEQALLFVGAGELSAPRQMRLDLSGITDDQFWDRAEQRIYEALKTYAEQAETGVGFQRRLFADDAAQGFAFIDLCRKRYEVVVMNPPFGAFVPSVKQYASARFPRSWRDMYSSFIERGVQSLVPRGFCGAITSSTYLNLSTLEHFREFLLASVQPYLIANLGPGVMDDAAVSAACSVICNESHAKGHPVWFIEARQPEEREVALTSIQCGDYSRAYCVPAATLRAFPQSIFAYWLSDRLRDVFAKLERLDSTAHCQFGLHCRGNDDRLFRAWWEIPPTADYITDWPVVKLGGDPEHFYRDSHYVLDWRGNGAALREIAANAVGGTLSGAEYYFRPGLTYIYTAQTTFSVQPLESGSVFSAAAHGCIPKKRSDYLAYLALLNTEPVRLFLKVINPNRFFQSNSVRLLPIPDLSQVRSVLEQSAIDAIDICRGHAQGDECSRLFVSEWMCATIRASGERLFQAASEYAAKAANAVARTKATADGAAIDAYHLNAGDLALLHRHIGASTARSLPGDQRLMATPGRILAESHLIYIVGCAFGRWEIRYPTGEWPAPELQDPFAPLPVCPPGMLQGSDGLPLSPDAGRRLRAEGRYPLDVAWDGILVDDPEHPLDLERRVRAALAVIWGERADALEHEACSLLGVRTLREWFRKPAGFFADHLKRYSKSRCQSPIYWALSSATGSYTLWVYYHRLTDQTLFTAVNDFVEPKLLEVSKDASRLRIKPSRSTEEETALEEAAELEIELREYRDELLRIAKFWKPNLNDGVQITAAPLWRLFQFKPWQKMLKETWETLEAGEYDWAHLAYSIWPDRVRTRCKTDKSLAIAHGLETLFQEPPATQKKPRKRKAKADEEQLIEDAD